MKTLFCAMLLSGITQPAFAAPTDIFSSEIIADETGNHEAELFIPMRGFLRSFPMGLSLCGNGIDGSVKFSPAPDVGVQTQVEGNCLLINFLTLRGPTTVTVTGDLTYSWTIEPRSGLNYQDRSFQPLVTDFDHLYTMTFADSVQRDSEKAWVCGNSSEAVQEFLVRPTNSQEQWVPLNIGTVENRCTEVSSFPWNNSIENSWEAKVKLTSGKSWKSYFDL